MSQNNKAHETLFVCVPINPPGSMHHYNVHKPTVIYWTKNQHVLSMIECEYRAEIKDFSKLAKALHTIRINSTKTFFSDPCYEITCYHVFEYKRANKTPKYR